MDQPHASASNPLRCESVLGPVPAEQKRSTRFHLESSGSADWAYDQRQFEMPTTIANGRPANSTAKCLFRVRRFFRQPAYPDSLLLNHCRPTRLILWIMPCVYSFGFFGNPCLSFSTGSKRSPIFSTRARTLSERNFRRSALFFFRQLATSSQVTGVETVGSSLARSEYTQMVVLCSSFWLQSTNTFPLRTDFDMLEVTRSPCSPSRCWARARDRSFV